MDVTDPERRRAARPAPWWSAFGAIDVLFNNAGIAGIGLLHETSVELWDRVMAVNVRGVFLIARAVLPSMIAAGRGSIINMSSTIAEIGLANRASYAASKGAVLALTRQMQADYAGHGIRVNALLPGTIHTPFVDRYLADSYDDPVAGPRGAQEAPADRGPRAGRRTSRRPRCTWPRTSRGSCSAPGCSSTAASAARSDRSMRLLSRADPDGERLAVLTRDDAVVDVAIFSATGRGRWLAC